jgi:predicted dehydrogenase
MSSSQIRIGIVGAGTIARTRHLPGFREIPAVKVAGVCNRSGETARRVAREFDIPRVYSDWEQMVDDAYIDAIVISAWPYLHCPVSLAAFDAGKHVLCQARMAMNAREAQRMHDRSMECPELVAMIVPSPYGLTGDAFIRSLIASGWLGKLRELHVDGLNGQLADEEMPMSWRQMTRYSGYNMLNLGILYETATRWVPHARRVVAYASTLIPRRFDAEKGRKARVGTADSVQVLTMQEDGSCGTYRLSGVLWHEDSLKISMFGSEGTLVYNLRQDEILGGRHRDGKLKVLRVPEGERGGWRVESDFIAAIRGERPVTHTNFATGVRYMQFTEAVARSSRYQVPVDLPLQEFSNPSL